MPRSSTARKRVRQNRRRRLSNRSERTFVKTRIKRFLATVDEGSPEAAATEYKRTAQALDRAARKRIIHPNLAARKKSRLARKLNTVGPVTAEDAPN